MASQVQIPFEGVILQEHSAPISCPTPNFAKGSHANLYGWKSPKRSTNGLPLFCRCSAANVSMSNLQVLNAILYVAEHGCK